MAWEECAERFINPYNFIGLGDNRPDCKPMKKGELTGVIRCTLKTVTPLAIPDSDKTESSDCSKHYCYPFFNVKGQYMIPGSEIRGMIRSAFEAATNSCMSVINTNTLTARHPSPRKPGLIKFKSGKWQLFAAEKFMINTGAHNGRQSNAGESYPIDKRGEQWTITEKKFKTGDSVNFTPGGHYKDHQMFPKTVKCLGGEKSGYLLLWEYIDRKHHNSIFTLLNNSRPIECTNLDRAVEKFNILMDMYKNGDFQNPQFKMDSDYAGVAYYLSKEKDGFMPVWYETVGSGNNTLVYLSPACVSRTVFDNCLTDIIGDHKSCGLKECEKGEDKLCPACRLFGMVGTAEGTRAYGSRIRFSDATLEVGKENIDNYIEKAVTLKELASPKISATEFYTHKPENARVWGYDYMITGYQNNTPNRQICKVKIRGRKFYHHINNPTGYRAQKTKRNATMDIVKENACFKFDIYFDKIDKEQLEYLLWVLTLGENTQESTMCHKLGHGKPLGLGSVKITIDNEIPCRTIDFSSGTSIISPKVLQCDKLLDEVNQKIVKSDENVRDLLFMTNTKSLEAMLQKGAKVSYPLAYNRKGENDNTQNASYHWFSGNRSMGEGASGMRRVVKYTLPSIEDGDLTLPKLKFSQNNAPAPRGRETILPRSVNNTPPTTIDDLIKAKGTSKNLPKPSFELKKIMQAIDKCNNPGVSPEYRRTLEKFVSQERDAYKDWKELYDLYPKAVKKLGK